MPCGDRARRRGSDIRQIAIVEEQRVAAPGFGRNDADHAPARGQAFGAVVGKPCRDLEGEAGEAAYIGGFGVDLALMIGNINGHDRWHCDLALRERGKAAFDSVDQRAIEANGVSKFVLVQQKKRHGATVLGLRRKSNRMWIA